MTNPAPSPPPPPSDPQQQPPPPVAKRRQWRGVIILLVIGVLAFGGIWFATRNSATNAKVGDCMHQTGTNSLEIVKCDSANSDFTVLGKVGGKEQIESTISVTTVCDQWPDTDTTYWQGKQGEKGDVLCLKKTK